MPRLPVYSRWFLLLLVLAVVPAGSTPGEEPAAKPQPDNAAAGLDKPQPADRAAPPVGSKILDGKITDGKTKNSATRPGLQRGQNVPQGVPAAKGFPARPGEKKVAVTAEQEAAALAFADEYHPELASLVRELKSGSPHEYAQAIRELHRANERLAQTHARNPERFALELEFWKLDSKIRLLGARLTVAQDSALEQELHDAYIRRVVVRTDLLALGKRQLQSRLEKLDSLLETARNSQADTADKQFENALRAIGKARSRPQPGQAAKSPARKAAASADGQPKPQPASPR